MVETRRSKKEGAKESKQKKSVKKMIKEIEKKEKKEKQPPPPVKKTRKHNAWAVFLKSEYQTRRKDNPSIKFSAVMADPQTKLKYQKMKDSM